MNRPVIKTITCRDLYELSQRQRIEVVDVRTVEEFADVRVPMAYNLPLNSVEPEAFILNRRGLPDEPIYFICEVGGRSGRACATLMAAGYQNVFNVVGGTNAWIEAGLPTESGA